jgi:hypothetical protein
VELNCCELNHELENENAQMIFENLKNDVLNNVSKGGTIFVVLDSPEQSLKDPELDLVLGNSWFSLELLNPELFKSQIKYQDNPSSSIYCKQT